MARPVTAPQPAEVRPPALILEEIALRYGLTVDDLRGPIRTKFVSAARHAAAKALRLNGLGYAEIGVFLGGRNHSTVMYMVNGTLRKSKRKGV